MWDLEICKLNHSSTLLSTPVGLQFSTNVYGVTVILVGKRDYKSWKGKDD